MVSAGLVAADLAVDAMLVASADGELLLRDDNSGSPARGVSLTNFVSYVEAATEVVPVASLVDKEHLPIDRGYHRSPVSC